MHPKRASTKDDPELLSSLADLAIGLAKRWASPHIGNSYSRAQVYQNTVPTAPNPCTYEPSLLVIPQGQKRVEFGKESYLFGETTFLLTSIELPIVSRVCAASVARPYLAFFLKLDMGMVRDVLHSDEVSIPAPPAGTRGMVLGEATLELLAPCCRMVQLLDTPQDVPFFGKLLQREIIYRLVTGVAGRSPGFRCHIGGPDIGEQRRSLGSTDYEKT